MMEEKIVIDFNEFFKVIRKDKWRIILITSIFVVIGITYSLLAREEFESRGKILPEIQGKAASSLGQFAGLANLVGVDLNSLGGSSIDAVRPDLYPDVITSTPFYLELFKVKVHTKENEEMTFEDYYHLIIEEGEQPKDRFLRKYPVKEDGIIVVNRLNEIRLKDLRKRITADIDKKSGIITISTLLPDPVVAAETAKFAMEYLMEYVKNYRTEKLKKDVAYLEDQVKSSRGKFYTTQEAKARYSDQYQGMRLQSADVGRERIEAEYRLTSSFYNELLKKFEESKFRLHQETPVFKVLEPPVAPTKKIAPKRIIIVLFSGIAGLALSLLLVLYRNRNIFLNYN